MDIFAKADIAEEVGRIYGYENIPEAHSRIHLMEMPDPYPDTKKGYRFPIISRRRDISNA